MRKKAYVIPENTIIETDAAELMCVSDPQTGRTQQYGKNSSDGWYDEEEEEY